MKTPPLYLIGSFLAFCENKNMSAAAHTLGISQPALTVHLKLFAECFSQDVFSQEGRRKTLTPFGQRVKELFARRFSNLEDEVKTLNDQHAGPEEIVLRLAGRGEILNYVAPKTNFPGHLVFIDSGGAEAVDGVLARKYELAISNHTSRATQLHAKKLFANQSSLLIPKKWTTDRRHLSVSLIEELLSKPYLAYKEEDQALDTLLQHYDIKKRPQIHRTHANWPNLVEMVELGRGWTLAPNRYSVSATVEVAIPASIIPETEFYILYRKETAALPWFKGFIDEIRQACV
jgi:DNA-binding transcriptional LysR family regulator